MSFGQARETFEFDLGQKINVLSDKAYRQSSKNEFEAVGNVVISHFKNTIYGERARINFTSGEAEVVGNVRYIAPELTLYGTKLKYNFLTKSIDIENARVLSDNYAITGKRIIQTTSDVIYAEDAEYTTCKDCPESWSIYGKKIRITVGKYVQINNAFIKVNGVIAMYIPYIIFPIKQKRETGFLFPYVGFSSDEGFRYQQPFFWVIDDYKDLTLTPSTFGDRGFGGELQYRQNIKEKTWVEFNSLQINDRIYEPYKILKTLSGKKDFRHFTDLETHYVYKHFLNGHIYFNETSDLDTIRDLDYFSRDRLKGTEVGGGGFLEGRSTLFSFGIQSYYNKNILISDPTKFDDQYVQILPKLTFSSVPYNLIHGQYPFLKNLAIGFNSDYTIFKQNKVIASDPIRNARRLNLAPYIDWQLGNLGPVFFSHQAKLDYQSYSFPRISDNSFSKKGFIYETEAKFELEKVYGLSYVEEKPINLNEKEKSSKSNKLIDMNTNKEVISTIGSLPEFKNTNIEEKVYVYNNSYRHSQEYKIKHYYLGEQNYRGNKKFLAQIENDTGQFDYLDALRDREHLSNQTTSLDSLPLANTIELQWNNNVIKKTAKDFDPYKNNQYLKDNFSYSQMLFFDISQGMDLNTESTKLEDRLTRLYVNSGFNIGKYALSAQEFFSHKTGEHKLISSFGLNFDSFILNTNFSYNSFDSKNTPVTKLFGYDLVLNVNDLLTFKNKIDYNLDTKSLTQSSYSVLYSPINNCWKLEFNYSRDLIEKRVGVLLYINYNENNFASINVR